MASVNDTRPHSVNQMGNTHSKPLAARHGRGTAWARHAMYEFSLNEHYAFIYLSDEIWPQVRRKCNTCYEGYRPHFQMLMVAL
jgi:hypothetical protein